MRSEPDRVNLAYEEGKEIFETFSLWEDAGFITPKEYVCLVELLHLSFLSGDFIMTGPMHEISEKITLCSRHYHDSFIIFDPAKMYRFAKDMKIEVAEKDDTFIAGLIIAGIIADYVPTCYCNDFLKGKNPDSSPHCPGSIS